MASTPKFFDRVLMDSTTTGTGTYTLGSAITGHRTFGSVLANSESAYYCANEVDANGNPSGGWEVGLGTYTTSGTTLSRDTILASSNGNAAVNWSAGTRRIFLTVPAAYTPPLDPAFGGILRGAKYIRVQASALIIGDTDLYTVPTGKRALVGAISAYNNSAGTIVIIPNVKVSGTYYRLGTAVSILTGSNASVVGPCILNAGDVFAVNCATTAGMVITAPVVEFDDSSPLTSGRLLGPSTGDNTLYTCPTGKTAMVCCPHALISAAGNVGLGSPLGFTCNNGTAANVIFHNVINGGTPAVTNQTHAVTNGAANSRTNYQANLGCSFGAGDFLNANVATGNAGQMIQVFILER